MKKLLLINVMLMALFCAQAQIDPSMGTPPQPSEFGKCYAKCWIPDKYETVEERVQTSGGETTSKVIPSKYETVYEEVMIKEASTIFKPVPAVYETTTQKIMVKEGTCKINYTPAEYETQTTQKLVQDATGKWERKLKAPNCLSSNPDDCYVLCWVEVPAVYDYDVQMVEVRGERFDTVYTDPTYQTISVQTLVSPATYVVEDVPAQYKSVAVKRLVECEGIQTFTSDAKFKTSTRKILVEAGGYTDWVEVVCDVDIDVTMIRRVQQKLNELGYNVGAADGIMGSNTKRQLEKYQSDNGLPVGNLNIATMEALGVK